MTTPTPELPDLKAGEPSYGGATNMARVFINSKITPLLIIATLLLLASTALAQSPFTLQGIGQNVETGTARDTGRGGWGLADRDTLAPSTLNPAALADLRYSQLTFSGEGLRTIDRGPGQDRLTWRVTVPNVRLAVPLRDGQLALHAGFNVKRSFSYESYSLFEVDRFGRTINGQELYRRDGNLFEIPVGLAWRPLPRVALGAAVLLVRGPVEDLVTQTFTGGPLANSYSERLELEGLELWLENGPTGTPNWQLPPREEDEAATPMRIQEIDAHDVTLGYFNSLNGVTRTLELDQLSVAGKRRSTICSVRA